MDTANEPVSFPVGIGSSVPKTLPRLGHWSNGRTTRRQDQSDGAEGGTRTPTGFPIRPSNVRVYQFHHFGEDERTGIIGGGQKACQ